MLGGGKLSCKLVGFEYYRSDRVGTCCAGASGGGCSRCNYRVRLCFLLSSLSQGACPNEYSMLFGTNYRFVNFGLLLSPVEVRFTRWSVSILSVLLCYRNESLDS